MKFFIPSIFAIFGLFAASLQAIDIPVPEGFRPELEYRAYAEAQADRAKRLARLDNEHSPHDFYELFSLEAIQAVSDGALTEAQKSWLAGRRSAGWVMDDNIVETQSMFVYLIAAKLNASLTEEQKASPDFINLINIFVKWHPIRDAIGERAKELAVDRFSTQQQLSRERFLLAEKFIQLAARAKFEKPSNDPHSQGKHAAHDDLDVLPGLMQLSAVTAAAGLLCYSTQWQAVRVGSVVTALGLYLLILERMGIRPHVPTKAGEPSQASQRRAKAPITKLVLPYTRLVVAALTLSSAYKLLKSLGLKSPASFFGISVLRFVNKFDNRFCDVKVDGQQHFSCLNANGKDIYYLGPPHVNDVPDQHLMAEVVGAAGMPSLSVFFNAKVVGEMANPYSDWASWMTSIVPELIPVGDAKSYLHDEEILRELWNEAGIYSYMMYLLGYKTSLGGLEIQAEALSPDAKMKHIQAEGEIRSFLSYMTGYTTLGKEPNRLTEQFANKVLASSIELGRSVGVLPMFFDVDANCLGFGKKRKPYRVEVHPPIVPEVIAFIVKHELHGAEPDFFGIIMRGLQNTPSDGVHNYPPLSLDEMARRFFKLSGQRWYILPTASAQIL